MVQNTHLLMCCDWDLKSLSRNPEAILSCKAFAKLCLSLDKSPNIISETETSVNLLQKVKKDDHLFRCCQIRLISPLSDLTV